MKKWKEVNKKRLIKICVIIVLFIGVTITGIIIYNNTKKRSMPKDMAVSFDATDLSKRTIVNSLSITGTIASAQSKTVTSSLNEVDVTSVNVSVGDMVKAGDIICTFDSTELSKKLTDAQTDLTITNQKTNADISNASEELEQTKTSTDISNTRVAENLSEAASDYTEAENKLASNKSAYEKAKEKSDGLKADVKEIKSQISEKKGELSELKASLKGAADDTEKKTIQSSIDSISKEITSLQTKQESKQKSYEAALQTTEEKKKLYEESENALSSASSAYKKASQDKDDTIRNGEQSVASKEDSLTSKKLDATTSGRSEKTQIEELQEQVEGCVIIAPIDGVITSINVENGETFAGGDVAVIQNVNNFIVEADVDEYDIPDIAKDQRVVIKTDATGEEELEGKVTYVAPAPEASSNSNSSANGSSGSSSPTYKVQIQLDTTNERLRIGMTAKASVILEERVDVFAVPYDAISTNANGESIIKVIDGGQREIVVDVGFESDYYTEISSDELKEGMMVVTGASNTNMQAGNANVESETFMIQDAGGRPSGGPGGGGGMSMPAVRID